MIRHYDRTANNISNENIDYSRTDENYNLAPTHSEGARAFVMGRIQSATNWERCAKRKEINVLCDTVVTLPKDYKGNEKAFFKGCYEFLADRYGKENVVSAFVHTDETTPHMHFAFVPICADGRLSAKDKVNRKDLQTLHKDCEKYLATQGIVANLLSEKDTSKTNKSIVQLQTATLREQQAETKAELHEIREQVAQYQAPKKRLLEGKKAFADREQAHRSLVTARKESESARLLAKKAINLQKDLTKDIETAYKQGYNRGRTDGINYEQQITLERENEQIGALQTQLEAFTQLAKLIDTNPELNRAYKNALAEQEAERERRKQLKKQRNRGYER